jgi:hypothetical protein
VIEKEFRGLNMMEGIKQFLVNLFEKYGEGRD